MANMNFLTDFNNLRLDIVGFLAILGEASVLSSATVTHLSPLCLLPRLLPAPQALIRTARPTRLPPSSEKVVGARNGNIRDHLTYLADLHHSRSPLPAYHVRTERISKPDPARKIRATPLGPLTWLSLLGSSMSIALLVLSITRADGFALLATLLLSILSTIIGYGSRWDLNLGRRRHERPLPSDHVIIIYPNGAFLIVECDEAVARELYWQPEECVYRRGDTAYRAVSLVGTILLMFGVICLGNATLPLQLAFAAAYMILNAAYWVVAALPPQWHWDLDCYKTEPIDSGEEKQKNFTCALWKVIAIVGTAEWVMEGRVAPVNRAWKRWVARAGEEAEKNWEAHRMGDQSEKRRLRVLPDWDADAALTEFLNPDERGKNV